MTQRDPAGPAACFSTGARSTALFTHETVPFSLALRIDTWKRKYLHMRKRRDLFSFSRKRVLASLALVSLTVCAALTSHLLLLRAAPAARLDTTPTPTTTLATPITVTTTPAPPTPTPGPASSYLYFVLKQGSGFVLARTLAGPNQQPQGTPQVLATFDDAFGQSTSDSVISLQLSPDGRYVAIDGSHSDAELLWIFDTSTLVLKREPAGVSGTFLHWIPGAGAFFLYRPILPLGPDVLAGGSDWQPGLWIVDALTGIFTDLDIGLPSTSLIDALASPGGTQIIFSTSGGLGLGSDIWLIDRNGQQKPVHLSRLADDPRSIAGLFSWSPDGQSIAYERLGDSPTPFLAAGLWVMNRQGGNQRLLAQADGGHGFALRWSPDSTKIAFVARTNSTVSAANQNAQALQSAVEVVEVASGRTWPVATPAQTGLPFNTNPAWSPDGKQITFAAYNPLNRAIGGSVRYASVQVTSASVHPGAVTLSPPLTRVIALG